MGGSEVEFSQPSVPCTPDEGGNPVHMEKDYFIAATHFAASSTRSLPERVGLSRNISWNPKIQFHEVYTATEYDRRGEIATCNRLTPMLAQQIKEELNSFKMVSLEIRLLRPHQPKLTPLRRRWKFMKPQSHTHTSSNEHTSDLIIKFYSDDDDTQDIGIHKRHTLRLTGRAHMFSLLQGREHFLR